MRFASLSSILLLAIGTHAASLIPDAASNANCKRQTYKVSSNANRTVFDLNKMGVRPKNNQTQITELNARFVTNMPQFMEKYITGSKTAKQTFSVSGILCTPKEGASDKHALQVLVHGIGFDSSYWNFQGHGVPEADYSYVYNAAAKGISTFRYDRLGTGQSDKPSDGYNVLQGATEVGVLAAFLDMVKNTNKIGGKKWSKTVLIGHSYGSAQSQQASVSFPDLIDGIILTGFSTDKTGFPYYVVGIDDTQATIVSPKNFSNAGQDYLLPGSRYTAQQVALYPSHVTTAAAQLSQDGTQAVTQGALFTIGSLGGPSKFTGPVQVLTGDQDFIFVFRQPNATAIIENTVQTLYPSSKNGTAFVPKNTGHFINVHSTANNAYKEMVQFALSNGL